jgi:hypothetical protein
MDERLELPGMRDACRVLVGSSHASTAAVTPALRRWPRESPRRSIVSSWTNNALPIIARVCSVLRRWGAARAGARSRRAYTRDPCARRCCARHRAPFACTRSGGTAICGLCTRRRRRRGRRRVARVRKRHARLQWTAWLLWHWRGLRDRVDDGDPHSGRRPRSRSSPGGVDVFRWETAAECFGRCADWRWTRRAGRECAGSRHDGMARVWWLYQRGNVQRASLQHAVAALAVWRACTHCMRALNSGRPGQPMRTRRQASFIPDFGNLPMWRYGFRVLKSDSLSRRIALHVHSRECSVRHRSNAQ